jgi:hypothetical protein
LSCCTLASRRVATRLWQHDACAGPVRMQGWSCLAACRSPASPPERERELGRRRPWDARSFARHQLPCTEAPAYCVAVRKKCESFSPIAAGTGGWRCHSGAQAWRGAGRSALEGDALPLGVAKPTEPAMPALNCEWAQVLRIDSKTLLAMAHAKSIPCEGDKTVGVSRAVT